MVYWRQWSQVASIQRLDKIDRHFDNAGPRNDVWCKTKCNLTREEDTALNHSRFNVCGVGSALVELSGAWSVSNGYCVSVTSYDCTAVQIGAGGVYIDRAHILNTFAKQFALLLFFLSLHDWFISNKLKLEQTIEQTRDIESLSAQCWNSVVDGGPTLNQQWLIHITIPRKFSLPSLTYKCTQVTYNLIHSFLSGQYASYSVMFFITWLRPSEIRLDVLETLP